MLLCSMTSPLPPLTPSFSIATFLPDPALVITPLVSHPCTHQPHTPFRITSFRKNPRGVPQPLAFPVPAPLLRATLATQRLCVIFSPLPLRPRPIPWSTHRASAIISAYHVLPNRG